VDEGKNYTKTLGIRNTQAQHCSNFLTQLEKDVLQDYGLQKDHVLCIVTDNKSNMVSMVKQLNQRPPQWSSTTEESACNFLTEDLTSCIRIIRISLMLWQPCAARFKDLMS